MELGQRVQARDAVTRRHDGGPKCQAAPLFFCSGFLFAFLIFRVVLFSFYKKIFCLVFGLFGKVFDVFLRERVLFEFSKGCFFNCVVGLFNVC